MSAPRINLLGSAASRDRAREDAGRLTAALFAGRSAARPSISDRPGLRTSDLDEVDPLMIKWRRRLRTGGFRGRPRRFITSCTRVYFISNGRGEIKIGIASDVAKRLAALQTAHASGLVLLASFPGVQAHERALHRRFAAARTRGEWFSAIPELLAFVAGVHERTALEVST